MLSSHKQAFTMIELIFIIVVIGILAAIAVPKFAVTRNDALNAKGKSTLAAVRSAIATERQKRILKGDVTTAITNLSAGGGVFTTFNADQDGVSNRVLEYPPTACSGSETGCWTGSGTSYTYKTAGSGTSCVYTLSNNRLEGTCAAFD